MRYTQKISPISCLLHIIVLALYTWLATHATNELLEMVGIQIHWIGDMIIGVMTGWVLIFIWLILLIF